MNIKILYDNEAKRGFKAGHGFSCFIEGYQKNILFDTGTSPEKLLHNMRAFKIKPKDIHAIVLSHDHGDHTGAFFDLLKFNNKVDVYVTASFPEGITRGVHSVMDSKYALYEVSEKQEVCDGVTLFCNEYSFSSLKGLEQSMSLHTDKGQVLVIGCAHPGLLNILKKAKKMGKVRAVIGGFHHFNKPEKLAKSLFVAPCHCSLHQIKEKYKSKKNKCRAGKTFKF